MREISTYPSAFGFRTVVVAACACMLALAALCCTAGISQAHADSYFANHEDWPEFCMRARDVAVTESQLAAWETEGVLAQRITDASDLTVKTGSPDQSFSAWPYFGGTLYANVDDVRGLSAGASATVLFFMDASDTSSSYVACRVTVVADPHFGGGSEDGDPGGGEEPVDPPAPVDPDEPSVEGCGEDGDATSLQPSGPSDQDGGSANGEGDGSKPTDTVLEEVAVEAPRSEKDTGSSSDGTEQSAVAPSDGAAADPAKPTALGVLFDALDKLWRAFTYSPVTVAGFGFAAVLLGVLVASAVLDIAVLLRHRKKKEEWQCLHQ